MVGYLAGPWEQLVGFDVLLHYNETEPLRQNFWRWLPSIGVCRHRQLRPLHNYRDAVYQLREAYNKGKAAPKQIDRGGSHDLALVRPREIY